MGIDRIITSLARVDRLRCWLLHHLIHPLCSGGGRLIKRRQRRVVDAAVHWRRSWRLPWGRLVALLVEEVEHLGDLELGARPV